METDTGEDERFWTMSSVANALLRAAKDRPSGSECAEECRKHHSSPFVSSSPYGSAKPYLTREDLEVKRQLFRARFAVAHLSPSTCRPASPPRLPSCVPEGRSAPRRVQSACRCALLLGKGVGHEPSGPQVGRKVDRTTMLTLCVLLFLASCGPRSYLSGCRSRELLRRACRDLRTPCGFSWIGGRTGWTRRIQGRRERVCRQSDRLRSRRTCF